MKYLQQVLEGAARIFPDKTAVQQLDGRTITYRELEEASQKLEEVLSKHGVTSGDRVGLYCHKSIDMVIALFAVMKTGAAYVPVDPGAPCTRNAYIFNDCQVKLILAHSEFVEPLRESFEDFVPAVRQIVDSGLLLVEGPAKHRPAQQNPFPEELAYILYTSGSTGKPKGVAYPHTGALSFVDWCSQTFEPSARDVFSSHAPFHFDLSIFDLYVCLKHGGTLILIGEDAGKQPVQLADIISSSKISIWYSTPSILCLLLQFGKLERHDFSHLRLVVFAGEVFPAKHLKALKTTWKVPRYFNLYGPTETNVCTFYEIPAIFPAEQTVPFPIGKSCEHVTCTIFNEDGTMIEGEEEGELYVTGPIMAGYWNLPEKNKCAFFYDERSVRWYKTGDIVRKDGNGDFIYVSRRDRMIKRRGFRVELGEIEAALQKHPSVIEAAAVAVHSPDGNVTIKAFLNVSEQESASFVKMKQFSAENLPGYMIPDRFVFLPSLPKTSTDKIDYQRLQSL